MDPTSAPAREAWRKYVSTGALVRSALREPVYRAWERCHVLGASPRQPRAETLSPSAADAYLRQRSDFVSAARPFMAALSRAAANERHAAMLGDENGIVLDIVGDQETVHGPEPFPGPGALLSDSPENRAHFGGQRGRSGDSGYPIARVVTLMALRTHQLAAIRSWR